MGLAALLNRSTPPAPVPVDGGGGGLIGTYVTDTMPGFPASTRVLPPPNETSALSVPAFWRGHAYVCGSIGMLPVTAWRETDQLDPQPPVIRQPDPNQTPMAFWSGVASALTLYGNHVAVVQAVDRLGYPTALTPVHPLLCAVKFIGNPSNPLVGGWYIAGKFYDPAQVWHVKSHLSRTGWPLGRGLLDAVPDGIAQAQALQDYGSRYFNSGGMPTGILRIHRPEITQQQADDAKANWMQKFSGTNEPAVLNELTDFTPVAYKPVDSQMIEARQLSLIEVALMWGMPPTKLGANTGGGTYRNAEMEEIQARNDAVAPWTALLEQAVSFDLLPRGQHAEWNLDAKLRADTLSRYQAWQIALGGPGPQSAWALVDEVRAAENFDPMADTIEDLAAEAAADEAAEDDEPDALNPAPVAQSTGNLTTGG
jgi:HK97 family phage portal protein